MLLDDPNPQTPPPCGELLNLLVLVSRYAGEMNRVERFTHDNDSGKRETVALHTLRLALSTLVLFAGSGAAWGTIGRALAYALVHDLAEIRAGDVVTLGGLTPEQRAAKEQREEAAVAELRAEMQAAAPRTGHVLTDLIGQYETRDHMAAQIVHLLDKIVPCVEHLRDGAAQLQASGWTAARFGQARAEQLAELRARLGVNARGTAADTLDVTHEALLLTLDQLYRAADAEVMQALERGADSKTAPQQGRLSERLRRTAEILPVLQRLPLDWKTVAPATDMIFRAQDGDLLVRVFAQSTGTYSVNVVIGGLGSSNVVFAEADEAAFWVRRLVGKIAHHALNRLGVQEVRACVPRWAAAHVLRYLDAEADGYTQLRDRLEDLLPTLMGERQKHRDLGAALNDSLNNPGDEQL